MRNGNTPDGRNFGIDVGGRLKTRNGTSKKNTTALTGSINALLHLKSDDCTSDYNFTIMSVSASTTTLEVTYNQGLYYDSASEYVYWARDSRGIGKSQIDGSGFDTFNPRFPTIWHNLFGIRYDADTEYIYCTDVRTSGGGNNYIIKTKFDATSGETFGETGSGVNQFSYPWGLDYDSTTGYFYVADYSNHRIVQTEFGGANWTTLGTQGSGDNQFDEPSGIWYDVASGYIYVADSGNDRIIRTNIEGTDWTAYGTTGSGDGNFNRPRHIAYNAATGDIYVGDLLNHRLVKTKIDGSGWATWDSEGLGGGDEFWITGLYFDSTNNHLYISGINASNHIIKTNAIFSLSGANLQTI